MAEHNFTIISSERFEELNSNLESLKKTLEAFAKKSNSKILYSEGELCKLLHLSSKTLQHYRNEGLIGFVRPRDGRRILYTQEHLEFFLKANETKAINAKLKNTF
jgi:hypothetical protein